MARERIDLDRSCKLLRELSDGRAVPLPSGLLVGIVPWGRLRRDSEGYDKKLLLQSPTFHTNQCAFSRVIKD